MNSIGIVTNNSSILIHCYDQKWATKVLNTGHTKTLNLNTPLLFVIRGHPCLQTIHCKDFSLHVLYNEKKFARKKKEKMVNKSWCTVTLAEMMSTRPMSMLNIPSIGKQI